MKSKILITGVSMFDIINRQMYAKLNEVYDVLQCKPVNRDIERGIEEFEPNCILLCIAENANTSLEIINMIRSKCDAPIIVLGRKKSCDNAQFIIEKSNIEHVIEVPFIFGELESAIDDILIKNDDSILEEEIDFEDSIKVNKNPKISLNRKKILIVDDDVKILKLMFVYLHNKYDVTIMKNGRLAMRYLRTNLPDLILLDYIMPEDDGPEVYRKIKLVERLNNIPIFFLTSVSDRRKVKKVLELKPNGYILKPVQKDDLLNRINTFFEQ